MNARDLMTEDVLFVSEDATLREVIDLMHGEDVRHVPVVQGEVLVGMVSDRDVRSATLPVLDAVDDPSRHRISLSTSVAEVMQTDMLTIDTEALAEDIIDLMIDHKVGALPVIDEDTGRLRGIVSYIDLLRAAREVL